MSKTIFWKSNKTKHIRMFELLNNDIYNKICNISMYKVKTIFENAGYKVQISSNSMQRLFDMYITSPINSIHYIAQIKTIANNDNKYPIIPQLQRNKIVNIAKNLNMTPIMIQYNYLNNKIHNIYIIKK